MTPNKRIALNVLATYGRSLYSLVLGLFTGRWVLMALGATDFGLVGLVGGLIGFVSVINAILASAVGRFYAVEVGAGRKIEDKNLAIDNCRKWFNTALFLHTAVPLTLVLLGLPIGFWAINNFLDIPVDRLVSCRWVWGFTCISGFLAMIAVPFSAMYTAKQEIAEMTIYSFSQATFNAAFLYYMVEHPGFWLVKYSAWTAFLGGAIHIIMIVRAMVVYPECRLRVSYLVDRSRILQICKYCVARFWSDFSTMLSTQGKAILVNKYVGVYFNASVTVANQVSGHATTLANSLSGAFWPAIANKCGEAAVDDVRKLGFMASRLGAVLVLVFALPLSLEVDEVLRLWLVTPPQFSGFLVMAVLFRVFLSRMTDGYWMSILGMGRGIMRYSWVVGWADIAFLFIMWLGFVLGLGMWSVCVGYFISAILCVLVRLYYGRVLLSWSIREWLNSVFLPLCGVCLVTIAIGLLPRLFLGDSFCRVVVSSLLCEAVFIPLVWLWLLSKDERNYILKKFRR